MLVPRLFVKKPHRLLSIKHISLSHYIAFAWRARHSAPSASRRHRFALTTRQHALGHALSAISGDGHFDAAITLKRAGRHCRAFTMPYFAHFDKLFPCHASATASALLQLQQSMPKLFALDSAPAASATPPAQLDTRFLLRFQPHGR